MHRSHFFTEGLERGIELGEQPHHINHFARSQRAGLDVTDANEKKSRRAQGGDQRDQKTETALDEREADARAHSLVGFAYEPRLFAVFLAKRLHDAGGPQHLVHH